MPLAHQNNLRKGRNSIAGEIYHITTTTLNRENIFQDFYTARAVINSLRQSELLDHANTLAFVVMPDHLHWLMQLGGSVNLSSVVSGVKSSTAHALGHPIWQSGFYDHALRKEENIQAVARYIVANPLRAGLVKYLGDYPHWDAVWL